MYHLRSRLVNEPLFSIRGDVKSAGSILRYRVHGGRNTATMAEHFADIKQSEVWGILTALQKYDPGCRYTVRRFSETVHSRWSRGQHPHVAKRYYHDDGRHLSLSAAHYGDLSPERR